MPAITDVVAQLVQADCPVLFLDTCELLHIIRAIKREECSRYPAEAVRLRAALQATPPTCRLVLSHLTRREWEDNHPAALKESRDHLTTLYNYSAAYHDVREALAHPIPFARADYLNSGVAEALLDLSKGLLDAAIEIDREEGCLSRAMDRVLSKIPPSRKGGEFKDCAILEHCLAVCRELRAGQFARKLIFCTSNVKDYCEAKPLLHPELAAEFAPINLTYKPNLVGAVSELLR
jgi:hypothetical protein